LYKTNVVLKFRYYPDVHDKQLGMWWAGTRGNMI